MKIMINMDVMTPPVTGVGVYVGSLAKELMKINKDVIFVRGGRVVRDFSSEPMSNNSSVFSEIRKTLSRSVFVRSVNDKKKEAEFKKLESIIGSEAIYWEPGFNLLPYKGQKIFTVYDLSFVRYPEFHPRARALNFKKNLERSLENADKIVAISEFTRDELIDIYRVKHERISVVPPGVSNDFQIRSLFERQEIRARLKLPEKYILTVGTLEPRKNLARLIRSYIALPERVKNQWPLLITGAKGWKHSDLEPLLQDQEKRGTIKRLGYLSYNELTLVSSCAELMVYPSLYEGFGLPVLEAMSCGVPVLTSKDSAMSSIAKEHAFYCNPWSEHSIKDALEAAFDNPSSRMRYSEKGLLEAQKYTWKNSGQSFLSAMRDL